MAKTPPASPIVWENGAPRSALYGDIYYSLEDGLAETQGVFFEGCRLPDAWAGRTRFTVAELGFGSGLNIAALLQLWQANWPASGRLHIFSVEAHPIAREDAARILGTWPQLAPAADALLAQWPGMRRGRHRLDLPSFNATFDLAVMEVGEALRQWDGKADAWFLDGFAPATNPAMWREEVLQRVAERSAPAARAATFTVAGSVRRGLEAAGFSVAKRPGHGRKRERLEAWLPGEAEADRKPANTVVIGGGIAGAALARAFRALGQTVTVVDDFADTAASGNAAALITPALDAGGGPRASLYAEAYARACKLYDATAEAVIAKGAVQIEAAARDAARFDAVAAQDIFAPGSVARRSAEAVGERLGEPPLAGGLELADAAIVDPARVLDAWLGADLVRAEVLAMESSLEGWRVGLRDGETLVAQTVVVAAGWATAALLPTLGLTPVRGQASLAKGVACGMASAFGAYAVPTRDGVLFGATHDRGRTDVAIEAADHERNLQALAERRPNLAAAAGASNLLGRASIRATTRDRMPVAGHVEPGLFVLSGLGSRGFTTAPLLAEHVAALSLGVASPLARDLAALVDPHRFSK